MSVSSTVLDYVQIAALVAAGAFFAVKVAQGWLMVNLSLSGTVEPIPNGDDEDALAVTITVTKGSIGSIQIQDTDVVARRTDGSLLSRERLVGTARTAMDPDRAPFIAAPWRDPREFQIVRPWEEQPTSRKLYRLPPGESTVQSCILVVPADAVCIVDAVTDPDPQQLAREQSRQRRKHQPVLRLRPRTTHLRRSTATSCRNARCSTSFAASPRPRPAP